jgi:hypothetical protein
MLTQFVHMVLLGCSSMGIVAALIKILIQILIISQNFGKQIFKKIILKW